VVGADHAELIRRVERLMEFDPDAGGSPDEYLKEMAGQGAVVGTPGQAAERLAAFEEAGAQRVMLQDLLVDDVEMLALLGSEVFPEVG
jgi:alkanesulfonate monooxygenase SsuD/methylene tetrahydromethanopterin reductase-like flavin-dependent oxidoreductase (luciferase family)